MWESNEWMQLIVMNGPSYIAEAQWTITAIIATVTYSFSSETTKIYTHNSKAKSSSKAKLLVGLRQEVTYYLSIHLAFPSSTVT